MKLTALIVGSAMLGGCLHLPKVMSPSDRYNAMCDSWLKSNISDVVVQWGAATQVSRLPDGTTMYEWDEVQGTNLPPERLAHFSRAQERGDGWCSTRFVVDNRQIITTWAWNGSTYGGCQTNYQPPEPVASPSPPAPAPPTPPPPPAPPTPRPGT